MRSGALILGLLVFAADLLTKWWVKTADLLPDQSYPVVQGFFSLRYVQNRGIAFGYFHELDSQWKPVVLSLLALAGIVIVLYYIWKTPRGQALLFVSFGLLLGGILGNFTDRLMNDHVVDFLELHWGERFAWPTFNLADAAITSGVALILFQTFFGKKVMAGFLALGLPLPALSGAQTPQELVRLLQQKYEQMESFSASFHQVFTGGGFQTEETGIVFMKKPGMMYWEYQQPTRKIFVSDGRKTYFYVPRDSQVMVSELKPETHATPLLFLLGRGKIEQEFDVAPEPGDPALEPQNVVLRLTPRILQAEFSHLLMEISPSRLLIQRLSVVEHIGNRNDYILFQVRENISVPNSRFQFKIPPGTQVIEADY